MASDRKLDKTPLDVADTNGGQTSKTDHDHNSFESESESNGIVTEHIKGTTFLNDVKIQKDKITPVQFIGKDSKRKPTTLYLSRATTQVSQNGGLHPLFPSRTKAESGDFKTIQSLEEDHFSEDFDTGIGTNSNDEENDFFASEGNVHNETEEMIDKLESQNLSSEGVFTLHRELTRHFTTFANELNTPTLVEEPPIVKERQLYLDIYTGACKRLGVIPVSQICKDVMSSALKLRSYNLGPKGTKAMAIMMVNNVYVTSLDLQDSCIGHEGCLAIAQVLGENIYITDLNLAQNGMNSEILQLLCAAIRKSNKIQKLNLSQTGLEDHDARTIATLLSGKNSLKELIISHNQFREKGGTIIGKAIGNTEVLLSLDISWNHLRGKGAVGFCKGFQENVGLKVLNLSWNGLSVDGSKALARALSVNRTIEELDITNNRLAAEGMAWFMKGLRKNDSLKVLKVDQNCFNNVVALSLLDVISRSDMPLSLLSLEDIPVTSDFTDLANELLESRGLVTKHGPVMKCNVHKQRPKKTNEMTADPLKIFFTSLSKQGMRVVDLYKRFDTGKRDHLYITKQQFKDGIASIQIPLTSGGIEIIMEKIEAKGEKVDLVGLFDKEKAFRKKEIQQRTMKLNQKEVKQKADKK